MKTIEEEENDEEMKQMQESVAGEIRSSNIRRRWSKAKSGKNLQRKADAKDGIQEKQDNGTWP